MSFIGNVLWLNGKQCFKFAKMSFCPFGAKVW